MSINAPCISGTGLPALRTIESAASSVVSTDAFPVDAISGEFLGKNPCADMNIGAGIVEIGLVDAETL
ncbi:MAG: hypothetical protein A3J24_11350 [Deltaproteobacteria bacterium RIFCSPLOWO2_02_FULL_53_8]|nr:MAG: hypothetical protein A3J24_11350 [Deltaproteobacteria bacterium RIFCSPLOWO2_02_FULL_53_8]